MSENKSVKTTLRHLFVVLFFLLSEIAFSQQTESCKKSYDKIYADGEFTMSLFLGYAEGSSDYVTDGTDKAVFAERLTRPCLGQEQLCGFNRHADDADIFTKTIVRANGKKEKVTFRISNSSYSSSHKDNLGKFAAEQNKRSQNIEKKFLKALQTDDAVFYLGHARRGTGPGFQPMTTTRWLGALATKGSLTRMVNGLKSANKTPVIIGMATCEGEQHYGKALNEAAPNSGLLMTRQTTSFFDATDLVAVSLEKLLQKICATEFRAAIQNTASIIFKTPFEAAKTYKDKLPEIYNFFEPLNKRFPSPRGAVMTLIKSQFEESKSVEELKNQPATKKHQPGFAR